MQRNVNGKKAEQSKFRNQKVQGERLFEAVRDGDMDKLLYSIRQGADVNARDADRQTPLAIACRTGNAPLVKALLEKGANPNGKSGELLHTPLMEAAMQGRYNLIRVLIRHKAEINAVDVDCRTALMFAAMKGNPKTVMMLLLAKPDVSLRDEQGKCALDHAKGEEAIQLIRARMAQG
ncbi:ankyrin repeat domain-containing protein [Candidatus Peregrinibacteria bacterium]|nr:ankyrin repeat domain-containing protein [Candidatus Peregrinibacteria bacterium]